MTYNFDRLIDRKSTSDIKWRTQGLRAFLPVDVSEDFIPMWIADMDFACPPCIVDAVTARAGQEIYGYCAPRDGYVEALKWWYSSRFGLELKREWLSVLPTVVAAINMGIRAFTQPGDQVIIQQPVYDPFASLVAKTGRELVNNALLFRDGDYYMDFDLLEKQAADPKAKVLILCSPHNPVGRVWTKEELARLGEICKRHQVLVISDEIHSDIIFSGHSHTPFPLASDAPCILCTAPGKTFNVAGLRASNIFIFDPGLKKQYDTTCAAHSMPGWRRWRRPTPPPAPNGWPSCWPTWRRTPDWWTAGQRNTALALPCPRAASSAGWIFPPPASPTRRSRRRSLWARRWSASPVPGSAPAERAICA